MGHPECSLEKKHYAFQMFFGTLRFNLYFQIIGIHIFSLFSMLRLHVKLSMLDLVIANYMKDPNPSDQRMRIR